MRDVPVRHPTLDPSLVEQVTNPFSRAAMEALERSRLQEQVDAAYITTGEQPSELVMTPMHLHPSEQALRAREVERVREGRHASVILSEENFNMMGMMGEALGAAYNGLPFAAANAQPTKAAKFHELREF